MAILLLILRLIANNQGIKFCFEFKADPMTLWPAHVVQKATNREANNWYLQRELFLSLLLQAISHKDNAAIFGMSTQNVYVIVATGLQSA